ncbi:histidine kinase N-terminal domain-containing protein [Flavonifractor plautii]|nr:histidine kinase N-terminal domain-containing protein [Flavonifractor plautii]
MVGEACDGMEAVEGCRASAPDVALLDIQMPLLDGVSVARQVLADRAAKCVIILTAFSDREHIERVQACGAAGYLTKPFEAEKILPTIELCIARSKEYYLLNKEYQHLSKRCQNREPIDQAKLLLMETRGMREDEAYQYIRELSRRKGMSMAGSPAICWPSRRSGMISATRMLCQKYTDLTDAEISYLESYGALLPALANAEQADVFIDCRTVSGRSAIVVCEAKPQTVPSNYRSSILGMLIHWRDE